MAKARRQAKSGDEATKLQSERSLVERVIKRLKYWKCLTDNWVEVRRRESVDDHFGKLEAQLDTCCAWDTLNLLAEGGRLKSIPKTEPRGFIYRI